MKDQEQFKKIKDLKAALSITDQEISESLGIDLEKLKLDKNQGKESLPFGPICTGWWSNNWGERE